MKIAASMFVTLGLAWNAFAQAVPPPEKLLPADTLGVFTVPDWTTARRLVEQSPQMRLWRDPALAPFVNKFWAKVESEFLRPLEAELGTSLTNYLQLAQGQVTVALTRNGWPAQPGATPGLVALLDARDQADRLKQLLAEGRAKLAAQGEPLKTERIAGTEFLVLTVEAAPEPPAENEDGANADGQSDSDPAADPTEAAAAPRHSQEIYIGQAGTLLVVGSDPVDLQKILTLRTGGAVMALAESTSFAPDYDSSLRDATAYGWLNLEPLLDIARQTLPGAEAGLPMGLNPNRMLNASGLGGLKTLACAATLRGDGVLTEVKLRIPELERRGLFRLFAFDAKDAAPPAYVPAEAVSFSRNRLDLLKTWNALESMVTELAPAVGGVLKLYVDALGKDQHPSFDFRRQFLGNLGDDIMSWQLPTKPEGTDAGPPTMALVRSPKPAELAEALKLLLGLIPPDLASVQESELAGAKAWSVTLPLGLPQPGQPAPPKQNVAFTSTADYLAMASDPEVLKSHLPALTGATGPSLLNKPGLRAAADKVGGFGGGMFGFTNDRETMRAVWEALKSPEQSGANPVALMLRQLFSAAAAEGATEGDKVEDWIDPALLPPFEQVQKYFHFSVLGGSLGKDGYSFKYFAPTPPEL